MQIQHFFICFTETVLIWILDYNIQNPAGYLNQNKTEQKKSWDDRESTKDGGRDLENGQKHWGKQIFVLLGPSLQMESASRGT